MTLPTWARRFEIYALCSVWPIAGVLTCICSYKLLIWSFGGSECFRRIVLQQPTEEHWVQVNPKTVIGMDTPLAHVPKFLETPGYSTGDTSQEHPHHHNYEHALSSTLN